MSAQRFSGHGSALAQCYNHMIMPLANARDKQTQVTWGIEDFRFRFGRDPRRHVASGNRRRPRDARRSGATRDQVHHPRAVAGQIRRMETDVTGQRIDPARAYRQKLSSGRSIDLFFYDGPVSQAVAFERLLNNGERFAGRLLDALSDAARRSATGAHRDRRRDVRTPSRVWRHGAGVRAGSHRIQRVGERHQLRRVSGAASSRRRMVEILENTAWSCVHGVGRWTANCGCNSGGHPDWNQEWRGSFARGAGLVARRNGATL